MKRRSDGFCEVEEGCECFGCVRSREKQAARDQDAADLASGKKTSEQLRVENGAFAFPPGRIRIHYGKSRSPR
jgi:hypothetical protein